MATNRSITHPAARFTDKVAIVTGGAGGLGHRICLGIGAEGGKVAVFDTNSEAIEQAVAELISAGIEAVGHLVDVRDSATVTAAVGEVATYFGHLDILIAAAGGRPRVTVREMSAVRFSFSRSINSRFFAANRSTRPVSRSRNAAMERCSAGGGTNTGRMLW